MCDKLPLTKHKAELALKNSGVTQYRRECRIYYCKEHNAWHLTSKDFKEDFTTPTVFSRNANKWKKLFKKQREAAELSD